MKIKGKQIAAILGIVALVGLYIATFIFAIIDSPNSGRMFQASLFATIAGFTLPIRMSMIRCSP